jgi:hypothetical protein
MAGKHNISDPQEQQRKLDEMREKVKQKPEKKEATPVFKQREQMSEKLPEEVEEAKKEALIQEEAEKIARDENPETKAFASLAKWFVTICICQIPIVGFIYLLCLALFPSVDRGRKNFARAFLIYGLLVLLVAALVVYIIYALGTDFLDNILSYVK